MFCSSSRKGRKADFRSYWHQVKFLDSTPVHQTALDFTKLRPSGGVDPAMCRFKKYVAQLGRWIHHNLHDCAFRRFFQSGADLGGVRGM